MPRIRSLEYIIQYQFLDFYKTLICSIEYFISYKNGYREREKKSQKNTEKNDPKKQKLKTEESLDNFVATKGDTFAVTKKLTLNMYFKLMVFDQIRMFLIQNTVRQSEKKLKTRELKCTDGIANTFLQDFDLLKEKN